MAKITINLPDYNSRDVIQFTPSFSYDESTVYTPAIRFTIPPFPSLLQANQLIKTKDSKQYIKSQLDSNNTFRLVGFNHKNSNNVSTFLLYLEGRWFYPYKSDGKTPVTTWNKGSSIANEEAARTLDKGSIIQIVASVGSPLRPLDGRTFTLNGNTINTTPWPTTNKTQPISASSSSVRLYFTAPTITNPAASTDTKIHSASPSNTAIKDYRYYDKYYKWTLSVNNSDYLKTLNTSKYIKDVVIFAYSVDANKTTKYLVQSQNRTKDARINITDTPPTYSQISSLYITSSDGIPKLSIDTEMYDEVSLPQLSFSARVIRYIDKTGQGNFTNAELIDGHNWVNFP